MGDVQNEKSFIEDSLRSKPNRVSASAAGFILMVSSDVDGLIIRRGANVSLGGRGFAVDVVDVTLGRIVVGEKVEVVEEGLALAEGPSINHKIREGLVWKCNEDPSFSFKTISNQFLLKGGD